MSADTIEQETAAVAAGSALTAELRRRFAVGPRSHRVRNREDLGNAMITTINLAATVAGYHTPRTETLLRPGFAAACSYLKHVEGLRLPPALTIAMRDMSPWNLARVLGEMVDAGVSNVGEGEQWFSTHRDRLLTLAGSSR